MNNVDTDNIRKQVRALLDVSIAFADTIRELKQVPAGHLYANVMGAMDLATFEHIIKILVDGKLVRREPSHLLVWIGPEKPKEVTK